MASPAFAAAAAPTAVPSPAPIPLAAPATPSVVAAMLPPSMPEAWIEQVRTAVKADQHSLVLQLLANSILAAVIAAGSSLCTALLTIRASGNLEIEKSQILVQRTEDDAVRASYDQLGANLGKLRQQFSGTALLIDIARSTNTLKSPSTEEHLREQFVALGLTEGAIQGLNTDARLDREVWKQVDRSIADITTAIVSVDPEDPDFSSFSKGAGQIEGELSKAIEGVLSAKSHVGSGRVAKPSLF